MARGVIILLSVGVVVYALVDVIRRTAAEVRYLPRWAWGIVSLVLAPIGALVYLAFGRVQDPGQHRRRPVRMIAPDDDPDFLRSLDIHTAPTSRPPANSANDDASGEKNMDDPDDGSAGQPVK
jgi:hypothetical protein